MDSLRTVKLLLGMPADDASKDELLRLLIDRAGREITALLHRETVPMRLEHLVPEAAVIYYNRLGTEGEASRSEGGASVSFEAGLPESIMAQLRPYRLAGVFGA